MTCPVCGRHYESQAGQLAHRIPQTKGHLKRYGTEVIHHELNLLEVCSLECNDAVSISNHPRKCARLLANIYLDLADKQGEKA